jgi:hypothetical protein
MGNKETQPPPFPLAAHSYVAPQPSSPAHPVACNQRGPWRAARAASAARSRRGPRRAAQRGGRRGSPTQPRLGL